MDWINLDCGAVVTVDTSGTDGTGFLYIQWSAPPNLPQQALREIERRSGRGWALGQPAAAPLPPGEDVAWEGEAGGYVLALLPRHPDLLIRVTDEDIAAAARVKYPRVPPAPVELALARHLPTLRWVGGLDDVGGWVGDRIEVVYDFSPEIRAAARGEWEAREYLLLGTTAGRPAWEEEMAD